MRDGHWMSWEGGVDLAAKTSADLVQPNVIVHVARVVHTPFGSAPAGMLLYQPDPAGAPEVAGFVCADEAIGAYFGPHIFEGTPFENAPVLKADIKITGEPRKGFVGSKIQVGRVTFEVELEDLGQLYLVSRKPSDATPFHQQGVECVADLATLKVNGRPVEIVVPEVGLSGGPGAVWAPCGVYAR